MSSNIRNTVEGKKQPSQFGKFFMGVYRMSVDTSLWVYANARILSWFIVTTGLITAFPLIFEIRREGQLEDIERSQIAAALETGKTPMEMNNSGITGAIEPSVLK